MNVIWIVADTFRQDHLGAYGKVDIRTPSLDALAAKSVRFDRHYSGSLMSVPARADFATGRWTLSFMGWEPLPDGTATLAGLLSSNGVHTAAMVDTPFYLRGGMNYDQDYQTFRHFAGQAQSRSYLKSGRDEHMDARAAWRFEADRNAPRTIAGAMEWLQLHYDETFFLNIDTWDPHEPWDAPDYYTELYWPDYDGEHIYPSYTRWQDHPGLTEEKVKKAHAAYRGEITMLDAWLGRLFGLVENLGLMESTAIAFTSDHGAYFGEHGGMFGKKIMGKRPDGTSYDYLDDDRQFGFMPYYEEIALAPLLLYVPGAKPGSYSGLTSAVDLMPTVLDIMDCGVPDRIDGRSLLPQAWDTSLTGRQCTITGEKFVFAGEPLGAAGENPGTHAISTVTTITTDEWSLAYTDEAGMSELYHLPSDPTQSDNLIHDKPDVARDIHAQFTVFLEETGVPESTRRRLSELRI